MSRTKRKVPTGITDPEAIAKIENGLVDNPVRHNTDGWEGENIWTRKAKRWFKKRRAKKNRSVNKEELKREAEEFFNMNVCRELRTNITHSGKYTTAEISSLFNGEEHYRLIHYFEMRGYKWLGVIEGDKLQFIFEDS
jgi:hypothetical protein